MAKQKQPKQMQKKDKHLHKNLVIKQGWWKQKAQMQKGGLFMFGSN